MRLEVNTYYGVVIIRMGARRVTAARRRVNGCAVEWVVGGDRERRAGAPHSKMTSGLREGIAARRDGWAVRAPPLRTEAESD